MTVLDVRDVSMSYGTTDILKSVSFSVNRGDRVGVAGVNGAGKTTLFSIITGALTPTGGSVSRAKDTTIGLLRQQTENDFGDETVYDVALSAFSSLIKDEERIAELQKALEAGDERAINEYSVLNERFAAAGGYEFRQKTTAMLKRFGVNEEDFPSPARLLSGGQKTKLSLISLLLSDPDIILLDEPTNHLDIPAIEWLEKYIQQSKKTFLIVSHDRYFLDRVTDHTLELENGRCTMYAGGYSVFREKKDKLREDRMKQYLNQQKEIKRLEAFIEQQRRWNRQRNIVAAESRQKAIDRMVKIEMPESGPRGISISLLKTTSRSSRVLSVRDLTKSFPGHPLFKGLSFEVRFGERLFIVGANGTGKSTLIKILTGREKQDSGVFELGYNQKIGYYDQEQQLLDDGNTVLGELWSEYSDLKAQEVRGALAKFGFIGDDVFKSVSVLSGGERARLSICKMIMTGVSLLILDEPTNHLDNESKETLESALRGYDGTVISVSHDRYFISSLADRILELTPSGFAYYKCGYSEFAEMRDAERTSEKISQLSVDPSRSAYEREKKDKNRRKAIERRIPILAARAEEIDIELNSINKLESEHQTDYEMLGELYAKREALEKEQLDIFEEQISLEDEYKNYSE